MSDMLRITGLVSGMDTDATVKKLIEVEQMKVDKAKQEKQFMEWQKEDYREISNLLRGFQEEYFDLLKPDTNMRSMSTYNMFSAAAFMSGASTTAVSLKTSSSSTVGSFSIDSVSQLATKDSYKSAMEVLGNIQSGNMVDGVTYTDEASVIAAIKTQLETDSTLTFTFDGVSKEITLDPADYDPGKTISDLASDLTSKLQAAFTNVDITVEANSNQLEFKIYEDGTLVEEPGHTLSINDDNSDLLSIMQLKSGQSNNVNTSSTLAKVFGISGDSTLTINSVDFKFTEDTKISEVMNQINASAAGVTLSFDSFTDSFTLESTSLGSDATIAITDTSGLLASMKLQGTEGVDYTHTAPQNAEFVVNGIATTRSSNTFEVNGTEVTLNEIPTSAVKVEVESDPSDVKDMITKFVNAYNEMIEKIDKLVSSSRDYDYEPLTDAQKKDMSEDDIEAWEKQARKGTLQNDRMLDTLLSDMRQALYESVDGLGISLYDIGIQTTDVYASKGKLTIDETKLDKALAERPNEVIELFTKKSSTAYTEFEKRGTRYSENGMVERLYDIIQDSIRLTRDDNGHKGFLIEKAGLSTGDDTTSELAKRLTEMDDRITDLVKMLADQEEKYYSQFAAMEAAMSRYSSQSAWLASQFGG